MTGRTAVIVVNYGSHALLRVNLTAVTAARPDLLVIVVDSFSDDAERAAVTALCAEHGWQLVTPATNTGYGVGNNLGVAAARAAGVERFLLLNPDARIDADSVAALEAVVATRPLTLAAPVVLTADGRVWSDGTDLLLASGRMRASRKHAFDPAPVRPWISGACLLLTAELWDRIDGFDDRYFLYWEDVDLSWRVVEAGGELEVVRSATAVHDEGATQAAEGGGRTRSDTYYYYNIRNRLVFAAHHLDPAAQRRWVRTSAAEAWDILLRGGKRQLLESTGPMRAALTGTVDGLRLMRRTRRTERTQPTPRTSAAASQHRPLRVLQSFPQPRPTTNPYIHLLKASLGAHPEVELSTFSWRRALTQRYDVFHAHWPEILVNGHSPTKKLVRQVFFVLFLTRLRLTGTAIVRTLHNLELPDGITRRERVLLRWFERWTHLLITINATPPESDHPYEKIVHGHYRDWFAPYPRSTPVRGRLAYFGLIRRYKAVNTLVSAFRETEDSVPGLSLHVAGLPSSDELRAELLQLADPDPRIETHLEFLTDAELVTAASAAELVVLPYRDMHNSGSVLAALSLDRRVLVPDNQVNRQLGEEVGPGWVRRYEGPLRPKHLLDALQPPPDEAATPDLSARDWDRAADRHLAAYRRAIALKQRPDPVETP